MNNQKIKISEQEILVRVATLPKFVEGVYSTNVEPLEKIADSDLQERPGNKTHDKIERAIHGMFWYFSNAKDLTCTNHENGLDNLRYAFAVPKLANGYLKGNDEEVAQALFQQKWDGSRHESNSTYVGIVVNTDYKKKSN